jgi:hypothetical protein
MGLLQKLQRSFCNSPIFFEKKVKKTPGPSSKEPGAATGETKLLFQSQNA